MNVAFLTRLLSVVAGCWWQTCCCSAVDKYTKSW